MLNIKSLSILAIAGSAAALPQLGLPYLDKYFGGDRGDNNDAAAVALEIVYETQYTTVTYDGGRNGHGAAPAATTTPAPAPVAAYTPPPFVFTATPSPAAPSAKPVEASPEPAAPASSSQPAAAAASSSAPVASSGSSDSGYMGIVNKWRAKMGMSDLTHSDTLEANAIKTAVDGNGQMVHELNPGSFAQVLAPGSASEFEKVFVGGWLCERPDISGLDGICTTMSQGWAYDGQTGHADILTSTSYSKIGCGLAKGIWGCDLA